MECCSAGQSPSAIAKVSEQLLNSLKLKRGRSGRSDRRGRKRGRRGRGREMERRFNFNCKHDSALNVPILSHNLLAP